MAHDVDNKEVPGREKRGLSIEAWIFLALTAFLVIVAIVYGLLVGKKEAAGTTALALTAGLTLIIGTFLMFVSRRLEQPRPEDRSEAEVSDGAGDLGFFSPGSLWPFGMAFAAATLALATAFLLVWLMIICGGFLLITVCGLTFEYHRRPTSH